MEPQHGNSIAPGAVSKQIKNGSGEREKCFTKNIVVLKHSDVTIRKKQVYMPNTIEMAQIKKAGKGQFLTQVPIKSSMTVGNIEMLLKDHFPCLVGQR